jgi:hypothetical protein
VASAVSAVASVVTCQGAPRDLGLDQGRACAATLAARYRRLPRLARARLRLGGLGRGPAVALRELRRHFPHQSESVAGLAVGARVPGSWLVAELLATLASQAAPALALASCGPPALLARELALPEGWIVRRSRPEGLFASVELTHPWLTSGLAGVNSQGLALVVAPGRAPARAPEAPAALLAQDCLERFAGLEAALEWCLSRPGGGAATLLLADSRGEVAGIEVAGRERRVLRPAGGVLVAGGAPGAAAEAAKALREAAPRSTESLLASLENAAPRPAAVPRPLAVLDPAARRLCVAGECFFP